MKMCLGGEGAWSEAGGSRAQPQVAAPLNGWEEWDSLPLRASVSADALLLAFLVCTMRALDVSSARVGNIWPADHVRP